MHTAYKKTIGEKEEENKGRATRGRKHELEKVSEQKEKAMEARSFKEKTEGYAKCEQVLASLNNHRFAEQLYALSNGPGYSNAIDNLIDLKTLRERLEREGYASTREFINDGERMWSNMMQICQSGPELYNAIIEMRNYFYTLVRGMKDMPLFIGHSSEEKVPSKTMAKASAVGQRKKTNEKPMSSNEKALLKRSIMQLPQEKLQGIIEIIRNSVDTSKSNDTLEFDIDKLPVRVARELEDYAKLHLPTTKKTPKRIGQGSKKINVKL